MILLEEVEPWLCMPDVPIRDVLSRIDAVRYQFQVIVDTNSRILGTVTDGDVRRAMLRGLELSDLASACMFKNPVTGRIEDKDYLRTIRSVPFLPLLDADGAVVAIAVRRSGKEGLITAMIMAGGRGSRMGEHTKNIPKPLLQAGDRPIIEHIISQLEKNLVSNIYISVHHMAEQIQNFVEKRDNRANIILVHEESPLGTAGSLGNIVQEIDGPLLVLNGDIVTELNFAAFDEFHQLHSHDATIAVARYDHQVPFGVIDQTSDGMFKGIQEKPTFSHFVAAGIYYLSPKILELVPVARPLDMPDLLDEGRRLGFNIGLFPVHEYWMDVGRPEDLESMRKLSGTGLK
jgi:dTDP-glucose pyrophosphorylase